MTWSAPETEATRRLRDAAPELLAVLRRILAEAQSWHYVHGHSPGSVQCDSICQLIPEMKRAIQKAEGRA